MFNFISKIKDSFLQPLSGRHEAEEETPYHEPQYPSDPKKFNDELYLLLLDDVMLEGVMKSDRTGTGTYSLNGYSVTYSLKDSFPRFTTKFVAAKTAIAEMLCFMNASTNLQDFHALNCHVWDGFADKQTGDLGPIYGQQWRNWKCSDGSTIDQFREVLNILQTKPNSRRMVVSAWNPEDLSDESVQPFDNPRHGRMALSPCHKDFQLLTRPMVCTSDIGDNNALYLPPDLKDMDNLSAAVLGDAAPLLLDMVVSIRSNDLFLGHPFNVVQYAYLLSRIAHCYNMIPNDLTIHIGDAHIYMNHIPQVAEQSGNTPFRGPTLHFPNLQRDPSVFFKTDLDDHLFSKYDSHNVIRGDVAVSNVDESK